MPYTIFFSWQSDTSASIGLEFVEQALRLAVATLIEDAEIERAIRDEGLMVDRDTEGVPGVPPIVDTIFDKIDCATIFVPDLTFVGTRIDGRPIPNPNVLVEYGWALKALGYKRIVPAMNVAFGEPTPQSMPFDMRHLRHPKCTYNLPQGASEEETRDQLGRLAQSFAAEIGAALRDAGLRPSAGRPAFPAAEPRDGQARFRPRGVPLGEDSWGGSVTLAEGPAMYLRVMPQFDPGTPWLGTQLKQLATPGSLNPFGSEAFPRYDNGEVLSDDGFGVYVCRQPMPCVVYIFKTGEIWGIDTYHLGIDNSIPLVEPYFIQAFHKYAAFLREKLGIRPPYQWIAGIEGVKGRRIQVPLAPNQVGILGARGSCLSDTIVKGGTHLEGASPQASLRPFFVEVHDLCKVSRPAWMDSFTWPSMPY